MKTIAIVIVVGLLAIVALFFAARWALEKEWEKESRPSFLRGIIISLASWMWLSFCVVVRSVKKVLEVNYVFGV